MSVIKRFCVIRLTLSKRVTQYSAVEDLIKPVICCTEGIFISFFQEILKRIVANIYRTYSVFTSISLFKTGNTLFYVRKLESIKITTVHAVYNKRISSNPEAKARCIVRSFVDI